MFVTIKSYYLSIISFLKFIELFFQSLPFRAGAGGTCMDGSNDYVMLYLTSGDDLGANDFLSLKVLSCPLRLYFSLAEDDSAFTIVLVLVFLFTLLDFVLRSITRLSFGEITVLFLLSPDSRLTTMSKSCLVVSV